MRGGQAMTKTKESSEAPQPEAQADPFEHLVPTLEERNVVPSSLPIAHEDIVRLMRDCLDRLRSKEELIAELNQHRMSLVAELESARREVAKLRAELVMNTQAFIDLLEKAAQQ